ncbi:MAG: hypothetical protein DMF95_35080 [Acidobacteria bacterium]|nr:MAG: hypothetical protein DMF96_16525 [Acidobacteriota bacterium]PYR19257.1 MAG: hypothetical protein DMF94_16665 [Acidobacteriota bacterium]PYR39766.1 MAG: hypothetical protein DMF95_35080 [Acidobacteriota bacterium]
MDYGVRDGRNHPHDQLGIACACRRAREKLSKSDHLKRSARLTKEGQDSNQLRSNRTQFNSSSRRGCEALEDPTPDGPVVS